MSLAAVTSTSQRDTFAPPAVPKNRRLKAPSTSTMSPGLHRPTLLAARFDQTTQSRVSTLCRPPGLPAGRPAGRLTITRNFTSSSPLGSVWTSAAPAILPTSRTALTAKARTSASGIVLVALTAHHLQAPLFRTRGCGTSSPGEPVQRAGPERSCERKAAPTSGPEQRSQI